MSLKKVIKHSNLWKHARGPTDSIGNHNAHVVEQTLPVEVAGPSHVLECHPVKILSRNQDSVCEHYVIELLTSKLIRPPHIVWHIKEYLAPQKDYRYDS